MPKSTHTNINAMLKYYSAQEDKDGDYVSANHTRYNVVGIDADRVHIPAGREGGMVAYDTLEEFLQTTDLERVEEHVFPVIPSPSPTEAELHAQVIESALTATAAAFESLSKGKRAMWEPIRAAVYAAMLVGDFHEAREIIETVPNLYPDMPADRDLFLNPLSM